MERKVHRKAAVAGHQHQGGQSGEPETLSRWIVKPMRISCSCIYGRSSMYLLRHHAYVSTGKEPAAQQDVLPSKLNKNLCFFLQISRLELPFHPRKMTSYFANLFTVIAVFRPRLSPSSPLIICVLPRYDKNPCPYGKWLESNGGKEGMTAPSRPVRGLVHGVQTGAHRPNKEPHANLPASAQRRGAHLCQSGCAQEGRHGKIIVPSAGLRQSMYTC